MAQMQFKIGDHVRVRDGADDFPDFQRGETGTVSQFLPPALYFVVRDGGGKPWPFFGKALELAEAPCPFKIGDKLVRAVRHIGFYAFGDKATVHAKRRDPETGRWCVYVVGDGSKSGFGDWSAVRYWKLDEPEKPTAGPRYPDFYATVSALLTEISYKPGWTLVLGVDPNDGAVFLQVSVDCFAEASMDSAKRDGSRTPWKSGKRYLSPHMCRQEVVGVAFDLIKAAEMYETHEWFRYKGASIYNPHLDPDALAELARKKSSFVVRQNAMSMAEEPR